MRSKKELLLFSAIILASLLGWLTTVTGVLFFGATDALPLLSGLTKSSMSLFSGVKLSAVFLIGFAFYKVAAIFKSKSNDWQFIKRVLLWGYSLTFIVLSAIVGCNMLAIFRI